MGLLALALGLLAARPTPPPPSAVALTRAASRAGAPCVRLRYVKPISPLEREETRCIDYALGTFRTAGRRSAWLAARRREAWFPARFVVVGPRWAAWAWKAEVARALRRALHGQVVALRLPAPRPRTFFRPCDSRPPSNECLDLPARPVPRGPSGPIYSYGTDYWQTDSTMAWGGLYVVTTTASGTAGVTGYFADGTRRRPPYGPPMIAMKVTLDSLPGPTAPPGPPVHLETVTDAQGAFAFVDIPVLPGAGSCYTLRAGGGRWGSFTYTAQYYAEVFEADEELQAAPQEILADSACAAS